MWGLQPVKLECKGHNSPRKHNVVRNLIHSHSVELVSLLNIRVKINNMGNLYLNVCPGWYFTTNSQCHKGRRVVVF